MKIVILPMLAALVPAAALAQAAPSPATDSPSASMPPAGGMPLAQFRQRGLARMMAADTDGDGRISKAEAQAMGPAGGVRMFDMADTNHDGYLDKGELQAALDQRFRRMDSNGDGVVTPEERQAQRGMGGGRGRRGNTMQPAQPPAPATPQ